MSKEHIRAENDAIINPKWLPSLSITKTYFRRYSINVQRMQCHVRIYVHKMIFFIFTCSLATFPSCSLSLLSDNQSKISISNHFSHHAFFHSHNAPATFKAANKVFSYKSTNCVADVHPSRKHAYIILTPLNPTFI